MTNSFMQHDVENLLLNKFVVIIGDSVQRGVYKDLVMLLTKNKYLTKGHLRAKGEYTFEGDELIEGGCRGKMTNGINYREVRQYNSGDHLIRFYFVTRCYNNYVESILLDLKQEPYPDVVIMNSCLWDITRYGRDAINEYKENLQKTVKRFKDVLNADCLFIWNCTLPISSNARGGFLIPEVSFMNSTLRLDIIEANYFAREVFVKKSCDVLDLHFHLRNQLHRRTADGIHWDYTAHRRITNLILSHIAKAWNVKLSRRLKRIQDLDFNQAKDDIEPYDYYPQGYKRNVMDYGKEYSSNGYGRSDMEYSNNGYGQNDNYSNYRRSRKSRNKGNVDHLLELGGLQENFESNPSFRRVTIHPLANESCYKNRNKNSNDLHHQGNHFGPIRHVNRHNRHPYMYKKAR
ncbi:PC-esterase domain-containing protein 1A [Patella vulgata]|uniref:PC-esterase domain-containing protein 1A n=1 Tax=Patella vulgata TaxID=6465 RepID=UPI00217F76E0|nr:PC-esterase domain-containing protein 1A [Patella vulgata]